MKCPVFLTNLLIIFCGLTEGQIQTSPGANKNNVISSVDQP